MRNLANLTLVRLLRHGTGLARPQFRCRLCLSLKLENFSETQKLEKKVPFARWQSGAPCWANRDAVICPLPWQKRPTYRVDFWQLKKCFKIQRKFIEANKH